MSTHDPTYLSEVSCTTVPEKPHITSTPRHIGELADEMSMEECLEQLRLCNYTDVHGHPLKNNLAFISLERKAARLCDWAQK